MSLETRNLTSARAIRLGDRYFYKFGAGGRVQTAWSLAGAKLFMHGDPRFDAAVEKIRKRGREATTVDVTVTVGDEDRTAWACARCGTWYWGTRVGGAHTNPCPRGGDHDYRTSEGGR